jgi:hypothetical protein
MKDNERCILSSSGMSKPVWDLCLISIFSHWFRLALEYNCDNDYNDGDGNNNS